MTEDLIFDEAKIGDKDSLNYTLLYSNKASAQPPGSIGMRKYNREPRLTELHPTLFD